MVTCKQLWGFVVATCMTIYGQVCYFRESASRENKSLTGNARAATRKRLTSRRMMSLPTFSRDQPWMPRESRDRGCSA